jgi:hypothetical protein
MGKHIHIHLGRPTADATGPKHAPAGSSKGGQFVPGGGGSSGAANPKGKKQVPKRDPWESDNKAKYGVHHPKGSRVRTGAGKEYTVLSHEGPVVTTATGERFHPTKLVPVGAK